MKDHLLKSAGVMTDKIGKLTNIGKILDIKINEAGNFLLKNELKDLIERSISQGMFPSNMLSYDEKVGHWELQVSESKTEVYQLMGMLAETMTLMEKISWSKKSSLP